VWAHPSKFQVFLKKILDFLWPEGYCFLMNTSLSICSREIWSGGLIWGLWGNGRMGSFNASCMKSPEFEDWGYWESSCSWQEETAGTQCSEILICFPLTCNILLCSIKVESHICINLCVSAWMFAAFLILTYSNRAAIWNPLLLLRFFFSASGLSLSIDHPMCLPGGLEEVCK